MRILIVEDDFDARDMLQVLLELEGHEVVATQNGKEAWDVFQKENFSLVISDWLMPEIDGLELCRMIRASESTRYCYVMLLTALQGKANYLQAMSAGTDDFITKPFDPDELRARLLVAEKIVGLQDRVKKLKGILPQCIYCKKIRDEQDEWVGIEAYISKRSEASFSHGVCPSCYNNVIKPELDKMRPK